MSGKSMLIALALLASLLTPVKSPAQNAGDAGVSGIPRGSGSASGVNNSVNDPSGIGNAARIQAPPPPSMAVPVLPSSPSATSLSPRSAPVVRSVREQRLSRREFRRLSNRGGRRTGQTVLDRKLNICRGC